MLFRESGRCRAQLLCCGRCYLAESILGKRRTWKEPSTHRRRHVCFHLWRHSAGEQHSRLQKPTANRKHLASNRHLAVYCGCYLSRCAMRHAGGAAHNRLPRGRPRTSGSIRLFMARYSAFLVISMQSTLVFLSISRLVVLPAGDVDQPQVGARLCRAAPPGLKAWPLLPQRSCIFAYRKIDLATSSEPVHESFCVLLYMPLSH